jgi:putative DNA methylase
LLTWASLNLLGGGKEVQEEAMRVQAEALTAADRQVTEWGIEHNDRGERADALLYCVEVKPEGCDYYIPLAPSWLIGEKSKVVARWHRVPGSDRLQPEIVTVPDVELQDWKGDSKRKIVPKSATVVDSRVIDPFDPNRTPSVEALRGPDGLRRWTNDDVVPRPGDVFQERLYCIRWAKKVTEINAAGQPITKTVRRYAAPDRADLTREAKVLELLRERFIDWQREGFIPSKAIVSGYNTEQPTRERGWTRWHHLFTPRQLLTHGLLAEISGRLAKSNEARVGCLLGLGRIANWDSRLASWVADYTKEGGSHTFVNQALNTLFNHAVRPLLKLDTAWPAVIRVTGETVPCFGVVDIGDARDFRKTCDLWVTDSPYADAINYHELGDFFLAWPSCGADSPRSSTLYAISVPFDKLRTSLAHRFALRLPADGPSRFRPCLRLALVSVQMPLTGFTYSGLSPHKFTPMPGVHNAVDADSNKRHSFVALPLLPVMAAVSRTGHVGLIQTPGERN